MREVRQEEVILGQRLEGGWLITRHAACILDDLQKLGRTCGGDAVPWEVAEVDT